MLIADEDQVSVAQLTRALSPEDYQIEWVTHGEDVLRRFTAGEIDILIVEVHLPDMPAWELLPQGRQIAPEVPVIAVTADDSWETSRRVRIERGPVFFYGLKPFNLREMREAVHCAAQWGQLRDTSSGSGVNLLRGQARRAR